MAMLSMNSTLYCRCALIRRPASRSPHLLSCVVPGRSPRLRALRHLQFAGLAGSADLLRPRTRVVGGPGHLQSLRRRRQRAYGSAGGLRCAVREGTDWGPSLCNLVSRGVIVVASTVADCVPPSRARLLA